ncbi:MAG: DolP-mannose mannosyltransferase [Acidobacteriota bacterium]
MVEAIATLETEDIENKISKRLEWLTVKRLFFLTLILSAIIYSQFQIFKQPIRGDRANWEYFAQVITRGGMPYRDVVNIKSPLSAYIGAAAIVVTRPLGLRDIYAVRLAFLLLGIITTCLIFLTAFAYFNSRATALLAAIVFLAFDSFIVSNSAGIQPKTPMILFGVAALLCIRRDRPFAAGVCSMLSALSWQPGLLFLGAAGLAFSRYLTSWRDLKIVKLLIGAALPLAVLLAHLGAGGAARDFYLWTIDFNFNVYAPGELKSLSRFEGYLGRMWRTYYRPERAFLALTVMGFLLWTGLEARRAIKEGRQRLLDRAPYHAVAISFLVYFVFCAINVQGSADSFPFLPFIAFFSAFILVVALKLAVRLSLRVRRLAPYPFTVHSAALLLLCLAVFAAGAGDSFKYKRKGLRLQDQEAAVKEITSHLQSGDKIFVHGPTEILVLAGLPNASRYFFLDRGKDLYLNKVEEGGFDGWFERLKLERPKIVGMTRLRKVAHRKDFHDWLEAEYEEHKSKIFTYYLRKDAVARSAQ